MVVSRDQFDDIIYLMGRLAVLSLLFAFAFWIVPRYLIGSIISFFTKKKISLLNSPVAHYGWFIAIILISLYFLIDAHKNANEAFDAYSTAYQKNSVALEKLDNDARLLISELNNTFSPAKLTNKEQINQARLILLKFKKFIAGP